MPNINIFLPDKLNKAIEESGKIKRRAKSDIIHLTLVREFLGEKEFKRELGETEE